MDHDDAIVGDLLVPDAFLPDGRKWLKPLLDGKRVAKAGTFMILDVIVTKLEAGMTGRDVLLCQHVPGGIVQEFHCGGIIEMLHEINL